MSAPNKNKKRNTKFGEKELKNKFAPRESKEDPYDLPEALNKERLTRALLHPNVNNIALPQQKDKLDAWMNKSLRKGFTSDLDDIEDAEAAFDQAGAADDGWTTDKVWTGKNIPSEFLQDLKAYREEKEEMASMQGMHGADLMMGSQGVAPWPDEDEFDYEYEYYDEEVPMTSIRNHIDVPDEKPLDVPEAFEARDGEGNSSGKEQESDNNFAGPIDADTIESLTQDRAAMEKIIAQLKKEDRLDASALKEIEGLMADKQELMAHWKAFEEDRAKHINEPAPSPIELARSADANVDADYDYEYEYEYEDADEPASESQSNLRASTAIPTINNSLLYQAIQQKQPDELIKLCKSSDLSQLKDNESALHVAVILSASHLISPLINKHGFFVDIETYSRSTPLHMACIKHNTEIIRMLLKHGANPNKGDCEGVTPLHLLVESNASPALIEMLISAGAMVNGVDYHDNTPLHVAAYAGRLEIAKILIRYNADVNKKAEDDMTALHLACEQGHLDLVKLLSGGIKKKQPKQKREPVKIKENKRVVDEDDEDLQQQKAKKSTPQKEELQYESIPNAPVNLAKLQLNALTKQGITPLRLAATHGHYEIVQLLIEKGAEINTKDASGATALHIASCADDGTDSDAPKQAASPFTSGSLTSLLLQAGALPDAVTVDDWTPLHLACQQGNEASVAALLEYGASVYKKNCNGATPLLIACDAQINDADKLQRICKLLIDHGANVNVQDREGNSPLHILCQTPGVTELVQYLIEMGANVNARTANFIRPLHMALQEGLYDVAKILVEHGANVQHGTSDGYTMLHFAALRANIPWTRYLIMCGVKLNAMADDGETALSIAKKDQNHNPNAKEYETFLREEFGAKDVDLFSVVEDQMQQEERGKKRRE